jgi:flagellar basal-body rod modification protein FlgD
MDIPGANSKQKATQSQQTQSSAQSSGSGGGRLSKTDFLKLLTSQLENQNPLDPTSNKDFVQQLARMTSLERQAAISSSVQNMARAQTANTSAQVVSFIGKSVQVESNEVNVKSGQPVDDFSVKLNGEAKDVKVKIKNSGGEVVKTIDKGSMGPGEHDIDWDGTNEQGAPVADGEYTVSVSAEAAEGSEKDSVQASVVAFREVTGVTYENGNPKLIYGDGKKTQLGNVQEVRGE